MPTTSCSSLKSWKCADSPKSTSLTSAPSFDSSVKMLSSFKSRCYNKRQSGGVHARRIPCVIQETKQSRPQERDTVGEGEDQPSHLSVGHRSGVSTCQRVCLPTLSLNADPKFVHANQQDGHRHIAASTRKPVTCVVQAWIYPVFRCVSPRYSYRAYTARRW